ncbi:large subunit ribosomal protein L21 [Gelidibacter algens]|jgi:large subunit ribosomal protein L21|uniref:Large ribosomal subunit protein bL21 n=1 Tax=Gelidibacter algens TaxID=49280 RepID=A0A1A7QZ69_9FLAO|nr:50S ribosomal protein L21 [Gelidibacter algens]OBX25310.1 50S ribosomal protein L21 [Gelidibacter algens]RAJ25790.1 large subunit ribosomal protein L21 [Gelidibacter algens]
MYAIVEIAGQQFKVVKDQKVFVHRLATEEGKTVSFDNVLLIGDGDTITLGAPAIDGAQVGAKVLSHLKGDKVIVFKKKRRKGYRVKNGHRQSLTEIVIESIVASGAVRATKDENKGAKKAEKTEKAKPAKADKAAPAKEAKKATKKEVEVSENLVTRAEHRAEDSNIEMNIDKVLHSIGTATKAEADDLKEINGIGPAYEERLNEVGIYTYEQISKLKAADRDELSGIDGITREKIETEEWVKQAKALLKDKK